MLAGCAVFYGTGHYVFNKPGVAYIAVGILYGKKDALLTLYVLAPLPILAVTIYVSKTTSSTEEVNAFRLCWAILTTNAQESYSGIRVIKSFVQEKAMYRFFDKNSEEYKENAIGLAKMEALYFPSMTLLIGLSTLLAIMIGGIYAIYGQHNMKMSTIAEFVMYINMLTFPVGAIGWTASMIQRAAASQKRINEFLNTESAIVNPVKAIKPALQGSITFDNIDFVYPNTGIQALTHFNLHIKKGQERSLLSDIPAVERPLLRNCYYACTILPLVQG